MSQVDNLRAVLCDPDGAVCIAVSDGDRRVIQDALAKLDYIERMNIQNENALLRLRGEVK